MSLLLLFGGGQQAVAVEGLKSGILSQFSVQAEASFRGSGTGTIYKITGIREFEPEFVPALRSTHTSVWRLETTQRRAGSSYSGRMDLEGSPGNALLLLLTNLLALKSSGSGGGFTTYIFRVKRSQDLTNESLRFLVAFEDGPWHEYKGVVITSLRVTVRAFNITNISVEWLAAEFVEHTIDPNWDTTVEDYRVLRALDATVEVDDAAISDAIELTFEVNAPRTVGRMGRDGLSTAMPLAGPTIISGALTQYFGDSALPEAVREGTEFKLDGILDAGDGVSMQFNFPRVAPQSGAPGVVGVNDVTVNMPLKILSDFALDEADETTLTLVLPT